MVDKTVKYLKDYKPTDYLVHYSDLIFTVHDNKAVTVVSKTRYYKNPVTTNKMLILNGKAELIAISLDDKTLSKQDYLLEEDKLILSNLQQDEFTITVTTKLKPWEDKSCEGLYASHNYLITQCEPEGFRKITFYQDRPDILAKFTTTIIAPNNAYSTMLSNGNKILEEVRTDSNGNANKVVTWQDPFKKPNYLFALVIGNLAAMHDTFVTKSGRTVNLEIYAEEKVINNCRHAMDSLKRAMAWDEQRFNLEYDLDTYMIVATNDFNMGAMENKGLNVFNSKYIIANPETATDNDFIYVEAVIGHEYFHNWTGNRVTCRNWFQLSLKEGLTVFRDHEFTADLHNRGLKRIQDVKNLRQSQFPEDASALAHSVRPQSYLEMNNFYTRTVYEKGAEVVRMYQTILSRSGFTKGLSLYLHRHDGDAATCEDFCQAMMDANNNIDLKQFMLWYEQAGTPQLSVTKHYTAETKSYTLTFRQSIPDTPGQSNKEPMLIPIAIGLLDAKGNELTDIVPSSGRYIKHEDGLVLLLTDKENSFTFDKLETQPIASILRRFSAPVILECDYTTDEHLLLVTHDSDEFNRWEHLCILFKQQLITLYNVLIAKQNKHNAISTTDAINAIDEKLINGLRQLLTDTKVKPEFKAIALQLPSFAEMLVLLKTNVNPTVLTMAINTLSWQIGERLFDLWMDIYNLMLDLNHKYDFNDFAKRSLKNTALFYILKGVSSKLSNKTSLQVIETIALGQYHNATNMTDSFAVVSAINDLDIVLRKQILDEFYAKWQNNEVVIDKWFAIQAMSNLISTEQLNKLITDKAFIATNPNKIYALLRTFTTNGLKFHTSNGYAFIADQIIMIDKFNSHVASNLVHGFNVVAHLTLELQKIAKMELKRILAEPKLSNAVYELADKIASNL